MTLDLDGLEKTTNTSNIEDSLKEEKKEKRKPVASKRKPVAPKRKEEVKTVEVVVRKNTVHAMNVNLLKELAQYSLDSGLHKYEIMEKALREYLIKNPI